MKKLVLIGIVILLLVLSVSPVAAVKDPNSTSIKDVTIYRNYLDTGDMLFLIEYHTKYIGPANPDPDTVTPITDADYAPASSFEVQLLENYPSSTSIVMANSNFYFGHSFNAIYLNAAAVTSKGLSFPESDLAVRVKGNPIDFPLVIDGVNSATASISKGLPPLYTSNLCDVTTTICTKTWVDGNTPGSTANYKYKTIYKVARDIVSIMVDVGGTQSITYTQSDPANVGLKMLNEAGSKYVMDILPSVSAVDEGASIFDTASFEQIKIADVSVTAYNTTLKNQLPSGMQTNLDTLGNSLFGKAGTGYVVGGIGFILITISVLGMVFNITNAVLPALVVGIPLSMAGAFLGVIPLTFIFIIFFFIIILFSFTFLTQRAG